MSEWGNGLSGVANKTISKTSTKTTSPAFSKTAAPSLLIQDLDISKLEIGAIKDGRNGDKFFPVTHDKKRLSVTFAKLPSYVVAPYKAGPYTKDGQTINEQWSFPISITQETYDKLTAFEAGLVQKLLPFKDAMYPAAKGKKGMSDDSFIERFNSVLKAGDTEKGYAPTIRCSINHETNLPQVQSCNLLDDGVSISKPKTATIHDLDAKTACIANAHVIRGIYVSPQGFGLKYTVFNVLKINNKSGNEIESIDYSGVTIVDTGDDDEEEAKGEEANPSDPQFDDQFPSA